MAKSFNDITGLGDNDEGALTVEQQAKLNDFKVIRDVCAKWTIVSRRFVKYFLLILENENIEMLHFLLLKVLARIANEKYLRDHEEISHVLQMFIRYVLLSNSHH